MVFSSPYEPCASPALKERGRISAKCKLKYGFAFQRQSLTLISAVWLLILGMACPVVQADMDVSALLSNKKINAVSQFKVSGNNIGAGFTGFKAGDCFKITKTQPYTKSGGLYPGTDFYVPFPSSLTYSFVETPVPSGTLKRVSDFQLQVDLTADGLTTYNFFINSILNPYSLASQNLDIEVLHYAGCKSVPTICKTNCKVGLVTGGYIIPSISELNVPSGSILSAVGDSNNLVGSTNGLFNIVIPAGTEFPKYGGTIIIELPKWYAGAPNTVSVFSLEPKTICKSSDIEIDVQRTQQQEHSIIFKSYKVGQPVKLQCTNYHNPIYEQSVGPFNIKIVDNEAPVNVIAEYPPFNFNTGPLLPRVLENEIVFRFYVNNQDAETPDPVPIQTVVNLGIEFQMKDIPIDNEGCFVKFTFPNDIMLPNTPLVGGYMSADIAKEPAKGMMYSSSNGINLKSGEEVFILNQEFSKGNYIIIKGCTMPTEAGLQKIGLIRFNGIKTPSAAKDTNPFKVEIYKSFTTQTYELKDLIASKTGFIKQERFTSGAILTGSFSGVNKYIQMRTSHQINFKIQNSLPAKNSQFDSRIVIVMPEKMKFNPASPPQVQNLDGLIINSKIALEQEFPGCKGTSPCFSITHSNLKDVPAQSILKFQITGTINQESVQDAGKWAVQTQIQAIATQQYFGIDFGKFDSNFLSEKGGISLSSGQKTKVESEQNYNAGTKYTFSINLGNYIPAKGQLLLNLPKQIKILTTPYADFQSSNPNLVPGSKFGENFVTFLANNQVDSGDIVLTIGGILNPPSYEPTDVFSLNSTDYYGNKVGDGILDNVKMTVAAIFTEMTVTAANKTNGAITDYIINFTSTVPLNDGDLFMMQFPIEVNTPIEPSCEPKVCLERIQCVTEQGRIAVTLFVGSCNQVGDKISFVMNNVRNPISMVKSSKFETHWETKKYMRVAEFKGDLTITNQFMANFKPGATLHQLDKNFAVETIYTLRFTPTNPIPRQGAVKVIYPKTVTIADSNNFIKACAAETSTSFGGANYCMLLPETRTVWFFDIFNEQDQYTSEVTLQMNFTNPETNFIPATMEEEDKAFQIMTFDFDVRGTSMDIRNTPTPEARKQFIQEVKQNLDLLAKGIDKLHGTKLRPELKCNAPCYNCQAQDPDACLSCWGKGPQGTNKKMFLQEISAGKSTCKTQCDNGFTVNGNALEFKVNGVIDDSKTFYKCSECDVTCGAAQKGTCQGQLSIGQSGDVKKCIHCGFGFSFFVERTQTCMVGCSAGFYTIRNNGWRGIETNQPQNECGECKAPCSTCRKCDPNKDLNCEPNNPNAGASFCVSCDQQEFFPNELDDLESVEQYFIMQASMVKKSQVFLTKEQKDTILAYFPPTNLDTSVKKFLNFKVMTLPDKNNPGKFFQELNAPLTQTGLVVPSNSLVTITSSTSYRDLYQSLYKSYKFPPQSLHENKCIAFCPDGFASVKGFCRKCASPCKNCKNDVNKCLNCLQTPDNKKKYLFGSSCYETCPELTVKDDVNMKCLSCNLGCKVCDPKDTAICYECVKPLLILNGTCYAQCPTGYKANFMQTECVLITDINVIYFPLQILSLLFLVISIGGKYSSKNIFGQHRIMLSFYSLLGIIDFLVIWVNLVLVLIMSDEIWHIAIPACALVGNYILNFMYSALWVKLDPPKFKSDDSLTKDEVKLINQCDFHFDHWANKYPSVSNKMKWAVRLISHKLFQFPYTHFYGYMQCTLRIQDFRMIWEWEPNQYYRFKNGIGIKKLEDPTYQYKGRLVVQLDGPEIERVPTQQTPDDGPSLEGGEVENEYFEGGKRKSSSGDFGSKPLLNDDKPLSFNPMTFLQSPNMDEDKCERVQDLRVHKLFKLQLIIDFILIRAPLIGGNIFLLVFRYLQQPLNQLRIAAAETVITSAVLLFMQLYIYKTWQAQKLPFKMKDKKSNYLFKQLRYPNPEAKKFLNRPEDHHPGWDKYIDYYKPLEIFLDNKLEELLNIFGKRQCKSCIEFGTGTELEEDPRRHRSFPLSPRGETLYQGFDGQFDLIDFQLQNNVYHDQQEPSIMFQSVARDFSDFGAQVFAFDVMNALNRKGGDLVKPGIDEEIKKRAQKKNRGRKNKYYRQIDDEDNQEANQKSDNEGELDHIREEEDEDEDEMNRRRAELEAARAAERKRQEEEAEKQRKAKIESDMKIEEERQKKEAEKKKKEQEAQKKKEEAERKQKEEEDKRLQKEEAEKKKKEDERKKKEDQERLKKEKLEQERKSKELKLEEERKSKEAKAEEMRLSKERKSQEEAKIKEQKAKEKADKEEQIRANKMSEANAKKNDSRLEQSFPDDKSAHSQFSKISVKQNALNNLKDQQNQEILEVPPKADSRKFNECDIIGNLDRDEKGNVVIASEKAGAYSDKSGKPTNQRGYLIDPKTGNIINNLNGQTMFNKNDVDDRGEVPAPFNFEKHNFNPHKVRGDFTYDKNGKPQIIKNKDGQFVDKKGYPVSSRGYRVDPKGNMIDINGRKKFDKSHMTQDGDLPKLFNYNGRRFDITDIIGQFEKDGAGNIIINQDKSGRMVDSLGRKVNSKGYLVDEFGNVVDKDNRQIFEAKHLESDEIPKIFPFTKFNIKNIQGEYEMDPLGIPILEKNKQGQLIDSQGRLVNSKGYLIDKDGNVINKHGKVMFKSKILDTEGDIPKVFRTGLLKSDTASSLSRLMSEIERNNPSEFENEERRIQDEIDRQMNRPKRRGDSGNTSIDSMMQDTPANYNEQNQRYINPKQRNENQPPVDEYDEEEDEEYGSLYDQQMGRTGGGVAFDLDGQEAGAGGLAKKRKKKKRKVRRQEYEDPSLREHLLAGAYGGVAKPKPKRAGVKYTTDINAGLRDIATPGALRLDNSRRMMLPVHGSVSGGLADDTVVSGRKNSRPHNQSRARGGNPSSQEQSESKQGGIHPRGVEESKTNLLDPQQRETRLKEQQMDELRRKQIAKAAAKRKQEKGKLGKDADFEKMFGKDIDEFLEDSEWDIESIDKMSAFSKGSKNTIKSATQASKLKGLEKVYLQRIETNVKNQNPLQATGEKVVKQSNTGKIQAQMRSSKAQFREGEDDRESRNSQSRPPRRNPNKAWDGGSRQSSKHRVMK